MQRHNPCCLGSYGCMILAVSGSTKRRIWQHNPCLLGWTDQCKSSMNALQARLSFLPGNTMAEHWLDHGVVLIKAAIDRR